MKKRITALLLSVVLCLGMLSTAALAAVTPTATGTEGGTTIAVTGDPNKLCALWGDEAFTKLLLLFYTDGNGKATVTVDKALAVNDIYYVGVDGQTGSAVKVTINKNSGGDNPGGDNPGGGSYGGGGGGGSSSYAVSVPSSTPNGTVKVSPTSASEGSRVTITATPAAGYEVGSVIVTDKDDNEIAVTDAGNGKYTFIMPKGKVDVKVEFVAKQTEDTGRFVDVDSSAWYADAVNWAVENGITAGTSATTFSPNAPCTRAQVVTFLWRAAGSPEATGSNPFTDVAEGSYYYDAVLWAVEKGITVGTSATTFSPDTVCTRAQIVTFLWRYEDSPVAAGSSSFTDVAPGDWFYSAVNWAVSEGVTAGTGANAFSPNADCTRAQTVTFLYRDMA